MVTISAFCLVGESSVVREGFPPNTWRKFYQSFYVFSAVCVSIRVKFRLKV